MRDVIMNKGDLITLPELAGAVGISTANFRIVDIMAGGMGTCLKLQHPEHESAFAVKLIRPELMDNDLASLSHILTYLHSPKGNPSNGGEF